MNDRNACFLKSSYLSMETPKKWSSTFPMLKKKKIYLLIQNSIIIKLPFQTKNEIRHIYIMKPETICYWTTYNASTIKARSSG